MWIHIPLDWHFWITFKLVISLLSSNIPSSFWDFFIHLSPLPANGSGHFVYKPTLTYGALHLQWVNFFVLLRPSVQLQVCTRRSQLKISKILLSARLLRDTLDWIRKSPPKSSFKHFFLKTPLLKAVMSGNSKSLTEGLNNSECEWGKYYQLAPNPVCSTHGT